MDPNTLPFTHPYNPEAAIVWGNKLDLSDPLGGNDIIATPDGRWAFADVSPEYRTQQELLRVRMLDRDLIVDERGRDFGYVSGVHSNHLAVTQDFAETFGRQFIGTVKPFRIKREFYVPGTTAQTIAGTPANALEIGEVMAFLVSDQGRLALNDGGFGNLFLVKYGTENPRIVRVEAKKPTPGMFLVDVWRPNSSDEKAGFFFRPL